MIPKLLKRNGLPSPLAMSWVALAVLLVLHWAAPAFQFRIAQSAASNTGLGFLSGSRLAQPGALPRVQSRITSVEFSLPTAERRGCVSDGGKPQAIISAVPKLVPPGGPPAVETVADPVESTAFLRAFDARAPPRVNA